MADLRKLEFQNCPYCGSTPTVFYEPVGVDTFFFCSCPDETCEGYNRDTFDDAEELAAHWNSLGDDSG